MDDALWWKRTFDGREHFIEDKFQWKTTLDDDNLQWKTTFDGRQPSMEDNLWWKTTFDRRRPLMEDNIWWKMTFDWRQPLMEDNLRWKTTSYREIQRFRSAIYRRCGHFFRCIRKPENVLGFRINDIVLSVPIVPNSVQDNNVVLVSDVTCVVLVVVYCLPSIHTQGTWEHEITGHSGGRPEMCVMGLWTIQIMPPPSPPTVGQHIAPISSRGTTP